MARGALILDDRGCSQDEDSKAVKTCIKQVAADMNLDFVEGPITACSKCGHFACVCEAIAAHKPDCKFLRAVAGAVPIECEHGFDVCPRCDPCTCHDHS